jgi:FkbH-like protein
MNNSIYQCLKSHQSRIVESWYAAQFDEGLIRKYEIRGLESQDRSWVRPAFITPLLNLLIEYLRTGDERYKFLYLDERLRYAPHLAPLEKRVEYFQSILPFDEAAVLAAVKEEDRAAFQSILSDLHAPLQTMPPANGAAVHMLCLGDCLMNEIRVFLPHYAKQLGIQLDMRILYFSSAMHVGLSTDEVLDYLGKYKVDLVAMSFFSFEGIPAYPALLNEADVLSEKEIEKRVAGIMKIVREFIDRFREHTSIPFLIHDACGLPLTGVRRRIPLIPPISSGRKKVLSLLNKALGELVLGLPKCSLVSETEVTARQGLRASSKPLVPKSIAGQGHFHTSIFGKLVSHQYLPVLKAYHTLRKTKLLLVDFDNTLWKGVMADGPVEQYPERQQLLRRLKDAGILLVALSKNTPENIRWEEMVLKPEDFVSLKINWNLKAQSVKETASELNLGMDSFVLIDDNPVEIDLIRQSCPQVVGLDSRAEETWEIVERLFFFPNTQDTEESRARTEMYRSQIAREKSLTGELDYPEMMKSLRLRVNFGKAKSKDLDRLNEIINRTNQFNTTTIRYSKPELAKILNDKDVALYVADLEDKFGKLGLVAAAIVKRRREESLIESFVMSCRAMGFGLENLMLRKVVEAESTRSQTFVGRFVPSDRNMPAAALFKNNQFEPVSETDWTLTTVEQMPPAPEWFTVSERS